MGLPPKSKVHIHITAKFPASISLMDGERFFSNDQEKAAVEQFSRAMKEVVPKGTHMSDIKAFGTHNPEAATTVADVWREADSVWANNPLDDPEETQEWLRSKAVDMKKALKDNYPDVRITLESTIVTSEEL